MVDLTKYEFSFPQETLDAFLAEYGSAVEWIETHNVWGNSPPPYHNTRHLIGVALCGWVMLTRDINPALTGLPTGLRDAVIFALLGHDYHYKRSLDDSENIACTLSELQQDGFFRLCPDLETTVKRFITYTQYPYSNLRTQVGVETWVSNLIRGADQLYATVCFNAAVLKGLFEEWAPREGITDYREWVLRNLQYVTCTVGAQEGFRPLYKEHIARCVKLHGDIYAVLPKGVTE